MLHAFDTTVAEQYGVDCAVLLNNLYFWIAKNAANDKHYHDGRYWTYNSTAAFSKLFPYWSDSQIYRILQKMERAGLIVTGNYNTSSYDRTKWYALTDSAISALQLDPTHFTKEGNGSDDIVRPIPDSKPDGKPDRESAQNKTAKCYGEFENVRLSDTELSKLHTRYGKTTADRYIETLSAYMKQHGKRYKDHYAALLNFMRRDNVQERPTPQEQPVRPEPPSEADKQQVLAMLSGLTSGKAFKGI